jgi:hypothetical protein
MSDLFTPQLLFFILGVEKYFEELKKKHPDVDQLSDIEVFVQDIVSHTFKMALDSKEEALRLEEEKKDILKAASEEYFTLEGASVRGLVHTFTSFSSREELESLLIKPAEELVAKKLRSDVPFQNRVFWALCYLNRDFSFVDIWHLLGKSVSHKNLQQMIERTVEQLVTSLKERQVIRFPRDVQEWVDWNDTKCIRSEDAFKERLFLFIDGTPIPSFGSSDLEYDRGSWKQYKKRHCYTWFCLVAGNGRIVYCSDALPGAWDDRKCYDECHVKEMLERELARLGSGLTVAGLQPCLGGDKGYPSIEKPSGWEVWLTRSGAELVQREIILKMISR